MNGNEIRPHLDALLEDLANAPPPVARRIPEGASVRIPVFKDGKLIGHVTEKYEDRGEEWSAHLERVHALRRALNAGDDPYLIAWLALSVGGGTQLPAVIYHDNRLVALSEFGYLTRKAPPDNEVFAAVEGVFARTDHLNNAAYRIVARELSKLRDAEPVTPKTVGRAYKRACEARGIPHLRRQRRDST